MGRVHTSTAAVAILPIRRKTKIEIGVYSNGKKIKTVKTNFLGPI